MKKYRRKLLVASLLASLTACQTGTQTQTLVVEAGESEWISDSDRRQYIRQLVRKELAPVKIKCRFTKEEFPKMEFKVWNTKVAKGFSPRSIESFSYFGPSHTYHASEVARFKRVPSIDVAYYTRMQTWRSCIIPTPYDKHLEWLKNLSRANGKT